MKRLVLTSILALLCASPAFAETAPNADSMQTSKANIRQQIMTGLQQAGFTNIKVMPDSFVVQATDKLGNPVTMFLNSNSVTVVSETESGTDQNTPHGMFTSVPTNEELSSQIVGVEVYNGANQKIGKIQNIAFDQNNLKAYIVGVGGFIGLGEHDVAVRPQAITLNYDTGQKKWHATTELTADQLKAAPDSMRIDAKPNNGGSFATVDPSDELNSRITDVSVYNKDHQNIGTIKDIAFDGKGIKAYILGVGGVLGLGERYVAVRPSAVALNYDQSDKKWRAEVDANADQLKAAPQYKYATGTY